VIDSTLKASGQNSFHLAQPSVGSQTNAPPVPQVLLAATAFLGEPGGQLSFASRLGWAWSNQVARVQVSVDDGVSWQDVWSQAGSGGAGETNFTSQVVGLAAVAGQLFKLRFVYDYLGGGTFFNQTDPGVGWRIDDITLSGVSQLIDPLVSDLPNTPSFSLMPPRLGSYVLAVRPLLSDRQLPWGPPRLVTAQVGSGPLLKLDSLELVSSNQWRVDFSVESPGSGVYHVQSAPGPSGPWAEETAATVQPAAVANRFQAVVPAGTTAARFYRVLTQ
jgi:hypothetical protein